jgi:hypothetical protein
MCTARFARDFGERSSVRRAYRCMAESFGPKPQPKLFIGN